MRIIRLVILAIVLQTASAGAAERVKKVLVAETLYVSRSAGVITGVYANPQPGVAVESISRDDAAVQAFLNPAPDPRIAQIKADSNRAAMITRLKTATPAQIDSWLAANVTNLNQARDVLGTILKLMALEARE